MKRVLRMASLTLVLALLLGISAMAAEETKLSGGFYGFASGSTHDGLTVKIEAQDADGDKITAQTAQLTEKTAPYYEGSVKLSVTCAVDAEDEDQFLVLLMDSNEEEIPLADDTIYYIDQTAGTIQFTVYPILPKVETDMMLYITSNQEGFKTIKIPLAYDPGNKYEVAPFTLGDIDNDGEFTAADALYALQMSVGSGEWTSTEMAAANVDRDDAITAYDSLLILQRSVGAIEDF